MKGRSQLLRVLFRLLILAHPKEVRERDRADMEETFLDRYHAVRTGGKLPAVGTLLRASWDLLWNGLAERLDGGRGGVASVRSVRSPRDGGSEGLLAGTWQDVRLAARKLAKSPGFTVTAVMTLAVGIGATVAIFSVLDAALLRALPFPEPEQLVYGRATFEGAVNATCSYPDYIDYRDQSNVFEQLALVRSGTQRFTIMGEDGGERVMGNWVTYDLFSALGVDPQMGRHFTAAEGERGAPNVAMISHGYWQRRYGGSPDVVGRDINMDGFPTTIVGVMPTGFYFRYPADIWLVIQDGLMDTGGRRSHSWQIVGRLRPGFSMEQAQAQVDVISSQLTEAYPESHQGKGLLLTPLGDALVEQYRPSLLVLMGATALLLLIACGNVAGLLVARATVRKVELSVRSALGASRGRLLRQLFTESLLMAGIAGGLGAVAALWLQKVILTMMPIEQLGIQVVGLSGPMLTFAVAASFGTAIVFGTGPALTASQANPAVDLKSGARTSSDGSSGRMRGGLVILQVALSVVLLIGSGLLLRSFVRLEAVDMGFRTENLLTAQLQIAPAKYGDRESRSQFYSGILGDIRAMPGVESVSAINKLPISDPWMDWYAWDPGNPPETPQDRVSSFARWVVPGYFETLGIPILRGRDHQDRDYEYPLPLLVINESMAEALFPGQDPVGRRVSIFNAVTDPFPVEVLGVVGDIRVTSLDQAPLPQMYFSYNTYPSSTMSLVVRASGDPTSLVGSIRLALQERDSDVPLANVATMHDIVRDSISTNRVISVAMALFAIVALFLAMTGLYGVLAYQVARRTHEIGVRVAFGAGTVHIMRSVLARGMLLVGVGLLIGCLVALGASRLLRWQLYQIEPTDPATYGAVAACFIAIGILACLVPARRATRVDPVEAFQAE